MLDPDKVAGFARRMAVAESEEARQSVYQEFLEYAADFLDLFSYHYHDFMPREDGNIQCTMDGYIRPRERVAYIVDTRSGFLRPVHQDAQRGTRHQSREHARK